MDIDIRIIQHKEFFKTTPSGEIDMEKSKQILLKLAALNKPPGKRDVLLDFRSTTTSLTIGNITELVQLMINHRDSFHNKLAILTPPGSQHALAAFMGLYAGNRGFQVAAFDTFEAAILWLATISDITPESD